MMGKSAKQPPPAVKPADELHDALDTWEAEANGDATPTLTVIRVDANDRMVVPFTLQIKRVSLHYLDSPALTGYVHCVGPDCVLCRAGRRPEDRDLLPVYDIEEQLVGVLSVGPSLRPHALRPQLMPVIRRLKNGERLLLTISRPERGKFHVMVQPLGDETYDGAGRIQEFLEQIAAGVVGLASAIPRLSNEELATIPKIAHSLKAKGIKVE